MRRVVSVFLPTWPTDRMRRSGQAAPPPDRPFGTAIFDGRRRIVASVNVAAQVEGLTPGMTVTHAQMLVPAFTVVDADAQADLTALSRLALWCQRRYAPLTSADPPSGLWLDMTGCLHFWVDERSMLADLQDRLAGAGISSRCGIGDTPAAAHAAARFRPSPTTVVPCGQSLEANMDLQIAALRLSSDLVIGLRRLGFDTIGQLSRAPRPQLALRFGQDPGRRLDQLSGALFEPIDPAFEPNQIRRRASFVEPISTASAIEIAIDHLVQHCARDLDLAVMGACNLDLMVERVDGGRQALRVGLARPSRDPAHLRKLLVAQVEAIEPGFGIDAISLSAPLVAPLRPESAGTLVQRAPDLQSLAGLIDSLGNRLGAERLFRIEPIESDIPERSWRAVPPLAPPKSVTWPVELPRPTRLLAPPESVDAMALLPDEPPVFFVWRHKRHRTAHVDGPERIHGEWWRSDREISAVRDYFQIEDDAGQRFWLFRAGISNENRWFLHGLFG